MINAIVLSVILAAAFFALRYTVRKAKKGECAGCPGCKGGCCCHK